MDYSQGEDLVFQDKMQAALEYYEALLKSNENDTLALREKLFCLIQLDRNAEAIKLIEKLKQLLPNDYKVKYLEIKLIIQSGGDSAKGQKGMKQLQQFKNSLDESDHSKDSWYLIVEGILANMMDNNYKDSLDKFERSYNLISKREKYLVAQEMGTLYHDIYQMEDEEDLQKQLGISKQECLTRAIDWFKHVGDDNPNQGKGYLIISQIYLNQDNYAESEKYCKQALVLETTKPVAQVQLASIILKRDNNLQKALELLKVAHTILKESQQQSESTSSVTEPEVELLIYQAKTLGDKGYIKEALQILEDGLQKYPKNPYVYLELGHTYFSSSEDDISKSVQYYQKCYEIDPDFKDPAPAIAIGSYYLTEIQHLQEIEEENEIYDSDAELDELEKQDEKNGKEEEENESEEEEEIQDKKQNNKSQKSQKKNKKKNNSKKEDEEEDGDDLNEGEEDGEEEDDDEEINQQNLKGKNKDFEAEIKSFAKKALEQFSKALKIDESRCQKVYKSIASCHRLLNKAHLAVQCYEKELEQDPDDVDTMVELVSVLRDLNNKKRAIQILEKIFLIDQTNDDMFLLLCELLDNNTDKIVNVLKKVYDKNPHHLDNIAQLIARAYIQFDQRQLFKQPEKWLKTAYDLNPKNPETLYTYGLLFIEKDQPEQALDWFIKCIKIDPDHIDCHEAVFELMQNQLDAINKEKIIEVTKILIQNNEEWLSEKIIVCKNNSLLIAIQDQIKPIMEKFVEDFDEDEDDDELEEGDEDDQEEEEEDQ